MNLIGMKCSLTRLVFALFFSLLCFGVTSVPQVCATPVAARFSYEGQNSATFSYDAVLNPAHGYDIALIPISFEEKSPRAKIASLFAVFGEFLAAKTATCRGQLKCGNQ